MASVLDRPASAIIVDFKDVIYNYSPSTTRYGYVYDGVQPMKAFLERFTVQDIISAKLINYYDMPGQESLIWEVIEAKFPDGTGAFGDCINSLESFQLLAELITQSVDIVIRAALKPYGLESQCEQYLFHQWVTDTSAILTHKAFEVHYGS